MSKSERDFWLKVLGKNWEVRCPNIVVGRVYVRFNRIITLQDGEDIFQKALLRMIEKVGLPTLETKPDDEVRKMIFGGYLPNILREWLRDLNGTKSDTSMENAELDQSFPSNSLDNSKAIYTEAHKSFTLEEQSVFRHYYVDGKTQAEIAKLRDCAIGHVNAVVKNTERKFVEACAKYSGVKYDLT
jgi:hypothetical protein